MANAVKKIGILTSGGDAPGMNAAIRAVVRTAHFLGIECAGIKRGYNGLIDGDIIPLTPVDVSGIAGLGGTILYTARSKEFMTEAGLEKAAGVCRELGIDGLVAIGGDGTFRGALDLSRFGISVIGIPATIDNDIACTSYTIGFDTACNTAIDMTDKLRDTMVAHERCSVVEVMGHHAGYLALNVGIAAGATSILVPEHKFDVDADIIDRIKSARALGRTHYMIIVAEGVAPASSIADIIRVQTGVDTRVTVLGHVQRGGSPQVRDRIFASRMGYMAAQVLAAGGTNRVICARENDLIDIDISEALKMKKTLDDDIYSLVETLTYGAQRHNN